MNNLRGCWTDPHVQIAKKLVESDYKKGRVEDPTKISPSQERHVKKHVKDFFEKAVTRKKERDAKGAKKSCQSGPPGASQANDDDTKAKEDEDSEGDQRMDLSDNEAEPPEPDMVTPNQSLTPVTPADQLINGERLKRKRFEEQLDSNGGPDDSESTPSKRLRSETPPPPPPPPSEKDAMNTTPLGNACLQHSSDFITAAEQEETAKGEVPDGPPLDLSSTPKYRESVVEHDAGIPGTGSVGLGGMDGSASNVDGIIINKGNGPMEGLGIKRMPELQLRQGS